MLTVLQLVDEDETERGEEIFFFSFSILRLLARSSPCDDRSELVLAALICQRVQTYIQRRHS